MAAVSVPSIDLNLLQGERVRLTAITHDDLPTLARWYQDAGFLRLFDARPAYPKSESQLVEWLEELQKDNTVYAFAVRRTDSDDAIGYVEFDGVLWSNRVCGFGMGLGNRADWGQGLGFEAAQLALAFAFGELNLYRVAATVFSYNERSVALLEKLGFQHEGTQREFLERDGRRYDMLMYGLLRHEWQQSQAEQ